MFFTLWYLRSLNYRMPIPMLATFLSRVSYLLSENEKRYEAYKPAHCHNYWLDIVWLNLQWENCQFQLQVVFTQNNVAFEKDTKWDTNPFLSLVALVHNILLALFSFRCLLWQRRIMEVFLCIQRGRASTSKETILCVWQRTENQGRWTCWIQLQATREGLCMAKFL